MKIKFYNNLLKIILSNLLLLLVIINDNVYSKPIPPGSGEGDVPANILILLDSSLSMQRGISTGVTIRRPWDIVTDSNNDIIFSQERRRGLMKINASDESRNGTFGRFRGRNTDGNCGNQDSSIRDANSLAISTNVQGRVGEDTIFIAEQTSDGGKVVAINNNGRCVDVYDRAEMGGIRTRALTIRTIGTEDHLLVAGFDWPGPNTRIYSRNLTTGASRLCPEATTEDGEMDDFTRNLWSIAMDDGNFLYMVNHAARNVEGYSIESNGETYCPVDPNRDRFYQGNAGSVVGGTTILPAVDIEIDPDDGSVMWLTTYARDRISKATIVNDTTVTLNATKGSWGRGDTTSDDDVNSIDPYGLHITSDHVFVGVRNPKILQFNNNANITWIDAIGGSPTTRFIGARNAIRAIMADSSLTTGANYGYGHWNSGRGDRNRWANTGQNTCHWSPPTPRRMGRRWILNSNEDCQYWDGWDAFADGGSGEHPEGQSTLCNRDSCIMVGIGPNGALDIPDALDDTRMAWGTDSNAFARMAWGYFTQPLDAEGTLIVDPNSPCQLNYVIVISDGAFSHEEFSRPVIETLRTDHGVKTMIVAYGGGLGGFMARFDRMAIAGSCDDPTGEHTDCIPTIVADTPQDLLRELQGKIHQIIADRLSFTAPSITATIQEGGSLYQAQFDFKQNSEWEGHLIRKSITGEGEVCHEPPPDCPDNWDAAEAIQTQIGGRFIWTAMTGEGTGYVNNWNNWTDGNNVFISELFDKLGNTVGDYHNESSHCGVLGHTWAVDGNEDDIDGLINFVRGADYFDYNGTCNITEQRDHILGDIYHSQIVEIGPPNANYGFIKGNEEAYFRSTHNYASFVATHSSRRKIIYAGANDGMLHAINASDGTEQWAFIPPFIAGKLPTIMNTGLDGRLQGNRGGSNAIFGVDGSPVVHDMYIRGLTQVEETLSWDSGPSWRTILIAPYGRGGAGFSVLDVTYPDARPGFGGPIHMFSVYNDSVNHKVLIADNTGEIIEHSYIPESITWDQSREAQMASLNQITAEDLDTARGDDETTEQDAIDECHTNAQSSGDFANEGTNACYRGTTLTYELDTPEDVTLSVDDIRYFTGDDVARAPTSVSDADGIVTITFPSEIFINLARSDSIEEGEETSQIRLAISSSLTGVRDNNFKYNYSRLGETWSTPRVIRIPDYNNLNASYRSDKYVFVMGGGMGSAVGRLGSNLFIVDMEDELFPGSIYGSEINEGPIAIIDTKRNTTYTNGSNILNAIPSSPVVITPDNVSGIDWRGAMVYVNDLEGKITKINLTNSRQALNAREPASTAMFQQNTLITLGATLENARLSYHSMDAAIGRDTRKFWLFGATGHYERINDVNDFTNDNILYGITDDYTIFKEEGTTVPPLRGLAEYNDWLTASYNHANSAQTIEGLSGCVDATPEGVNCPTNADAGWMVYLNRDEAGNLTRQGKKASATPRVYKGNVYYPIYMPTQTANRCNLGRAYICATDDECGTNNSNHLSSEEGEMPDDDSCYFVREGILSELVVFSDTLYGNIATKAESQQDTLVQVLSGAGEVNTYRRSWRENY